MGTAAHLITPGSFEEINIASYLNYHDTQLYPLALSTIECDSICLPSITVTGGLPVSLGKILENKGQVSHIYFKRSFGLFQPPSSL